jgi:hypothetical protein
MKNIISRIRTTDERDALIAEIDMLLANLYEHKGAGFTSALHSQVRVWVAEELRNGIPENIDAVENYLKSMKERLEKLKVISLKIAFEPTDSSIDKFSDFSRKNISPDVILDITTDAKIYGGAEITYNGEFRDFSLKRLFQEEYSKQKDELMKIIHPKEQV